MFDPHTVFLVGVVSQVVLALTLALLAVGDKRTRGTGWFAAGSCLQLLMTSSGPMARSERETVLAGAGACVVVLMVFFLYMGFRWFTVRRALKTRTLPLAVSAALAAVLLISFHNVGTGLMVARVVAIVMLAKMTVMLWHPQVAAMQRMARATAVVVGALALTLLGRMAAELLAHGLVGDQLDFAGRLATMFFTTALSFSFVGFFVTEIERRLHDETRIDILTGLSNRRSLEEVVVREIKACEHHRTPLALLVLDLDYFKKLNDTWGHAVGDRALKCMGDVLHLHIAAPEWTARLGGEEFAVLLPGVSMEEATATAELLRHRVEELGIEEGGEMVTFTVSIGVSALRPGERTWMDMLRRADKALYRAKNEGRNRVSASTEADSSRESRSDARVLTWRRSWPSPNAAARTLQAKATAPEAGNEAHHQLPRGVFPLPRDPISIRASQWLS